MLIRFNLVYILSQILPMDASSAWLLCPSEMPSEVFFSWFYLKFFFYLFERQKVKDPYAYLLPNCPQCPGFKAKGWELNPDFPRVTRTSRPLHKVCIDGKLELGARAKNWTQVLWCGTWVSLTSSLNAQSPFGLSFCYIWHHRWYIGLISLVYFILESACL